jgi:protein transport protein SEC61 subunit alpha
MGHGISLFITSNVCENIFWRSFSPITLRTDAGTEFEGSIIAFFHSMLTNKVNK